MAEARPAIVRQVIGHQAFRSWCYLVACPDSGRAILIDPGGSPEAVLAMAAPFPLDTIVLTHGHRDHWEGVAAVRRARPVPVVAPPDDWDMLGFTPDGSLAHGELLAVGGLGLRAIHTPGHTAGSTCLLLDTIVFSGDTLFPGGPGRTRSPEALSQIIESITTRLYTLPDATRVLPGHGSPTTIGASRTEYAAFAARRHPPDLHGDVLWATS